LHRRRRIFETYPLRDRIALALLIMALGLGMWAFLLAALGRNANPPGKRLSIFMAILSVASLAGLAWELFTEPQSTATVAWLAAIAFMNAAWLYSFFTGRARLRSSR
jgi:hypothetical protein